MDDIDFGQLQIWTADEVATAIRRLLPSNATLSHQYHTEGYFEVLVKIPGKPELFEQNVDLRIALLNVFGALLPNPAKRDPRWEVRSATGSVQHVKTTNPDEDPADLDPASIEAVYRLKL